MLKKVKLSPSMTPRTMMKMKQNPMLRNAAGMRLSAERLSLDHLKNSLKKRCRI